MNLPQLRTPPNSLEAEQSVIGALLLGAPFDMVSASLAAEDFYHPQHRAVFVACGLLAAKGQKIDLITISDALEARNELEAIGGLAYLAELAKNTPSTSNVYAYSKVVRDRAVQRAVVIAGMTISQIGFGDGSTEDKVAEAQRLVLALGSDADSNDVLPVNDHLRDFLDQIEERGKVAGHIGIDTGFFELDNFYKGMKPGHVHVIAARPGTGKTTLALNIIENVTEKNHAALIFSLEMPANELTKNLVCSLGRLQKDSLDDGTMTQEHWTALGRGVGRLKKMPIYICDRPGLTVGRIRAIARFQKKAYGIRFVMVDHIGLVKTPGDQNRTIELGEVSRQLKEMAKELDITLIELVQLNRGIEQRADKTPTMADIRDSGEIEQDADTIAIMYRHQNSQNGTTDVTIAKNRHGKTGKLQLVLKGEYSRFENFSKPDAPGSPSQPPQTWADRYDQ